MPNEDKHLICKMLCRTLQLTRNLFDLLDLSFDPETEIVTATFISGGKKHVNVAGDSGTAMIQDIMAHII